jgi:hypothetical protein
MNKNLTLLFLISSSLLGCGSDSNDLIGSGSARVEDILFSKQTIKVEEGLVIATDFSYSSLNVIGNNDNVAVIIKLPPELKFSENTAEIDGSTDKKVGAQVLLCDSGSTYLTFDLDRFDFEQATAPAGADARLTFTATGAKTGDAIIEARARIKSNKVNCDTIFLPDDSEVISVRAK